MVARNIGGSLTLEAYKKMAQSAKEGEKLSVPTAEALCSKCMQPLSHHINTTELLCRLQADPSK
jgi:hypothetical protein